MSSLSEDVREALMGPQLGEVAKRVREGAPVPGMQNWQGNRAVFIQEHLGAWFRSNDPAELVPLLERAPDAIGHRAVGALLYRLRRLVERVEVEKLGGPVWLEDEQPVPEGTCKAADDLLRDLAAAMASGVMGEPGWTVKPPTKPGRKKRSLSDEIESVQILDDYEFVLAHLPKADLRKRRGETEWAWIGRRKQLLRKAWTDSIGTDYRWPAPESGDEVGSVVPLELPQAVLNDVVRSSRDQIAYGLVGHRRRMDPRSVRHHVEAARKSGQPRRRI